MPLAAISNLATPFAKQYSWYLFCMADHLKQQTKWYIVRCFREVPRRAEWKNLLHKKYQTALHMKYIYRKEKKKPWQCTIARWCGNVQRAYCKHVELSAIEYMHEKCESCNNQTQNRSERTPHILSGLKEQAILLSELCCSNLNCVAHWSFQAFHRCLNFKLLRC